MPGASGATVADQSPRQGEPGPGKLGRDLCTTRGTKTVRGCEVGSVGLLASFRGTSRTPPIASRKTGREDGYTIPGHNANQCSEPALADWIVIGNGHVEEDNTQTIAVGATKRQALPLAAGEAGGQDVFVADQPRRVDNPGLAQERGSLLFSPMV